MAKYIRKINKRSVWNVGAESYQSQNILHNIPSDVFVRCMDSKDNSLSIWKVNGDSWDDYGDIIATIISGSDGPSTTDLVLIDDELMVEFSLKQYDGDTKASIEMNKKHYDITELTHFKIGVLAEYIGLKLAEDDYQKEKSLARGKYYKRFNERALIAFMQSAVSKGCINKNDLSERWQKRLS